MKILVADDSQAVRDMLAAWATEFGYEVILAADGQQALDLSFSDARIDLALVEWEMPKLAGVDVCWQVRAATESARYVYVILMTGDPNPDRLIEALDCGADDFIRKPFDKASLMARVRTGARIVTMQREMERLAQTDPLTGARNRRSFFDRAAHDNASASASGGPLSVLLVDIDRFKRINDTYGHNAGDEAIRTLVAVCDRVLRATDTLGRLGGEEFAILLPGADAAIAAVVGERLRAAVAETPVDYGGHRFRMSVSVGVAQADPARGGIEAAIAGADSALYRAKNGGRNRVERWDGTAARPAPAAAGADGCPDGGGAVRPRRHRPARAC